MPKCGFIRNHKHENSKDSYAKIGAFRTVQFACMADVVITPYITLKSWRQQWS